MTSSFDNETNKVEDEYYGEEEDDLDDYIVYSDDDEDKPLKKQKLHQQEEEEDQQEEAGEEFEEEEEEEEVPAGVQEILSLREQLKEKIRRKNAAMAAGVRNGSSSVKHIAQPAKDRFGTFFGPSRQSLAPRVIQEGCTSMVKELQTPRPRNDASLVSESKPGTSRSLQKPKIISEEKRRADALRENRDYSSLFSDDAEAPPSTKEKPGNRPALVPKPDVQVRGPVSSAGKNRPTNGQGQTARLLSNGRGLKGVPPSGQGRVQNKAGSPGNGPLAVADRKRMVAAARNGSTPAAMKKTTGLQPSSNGQKMHPTLQSKMPQAMPPGQRQQQPSQRPKPQQASQSQSNGHQQMSRAKPALKRLVASSKLKVKSGDEFDYQKELRALTGYYPSKYAGRDEDDRNMEADYASILKEERRSAKLARQEDQEQLRLIQEEERRERIKKRKKPVTDARLEGAELS